MRSRRGLRGGEPVPVRGVVRGDLGVRESVRQMENVILSDRRERRDALPDLRADPAGVVLGDRDDRQRRHSHPPLLRASSWLLTKPLGAYMAAVFEGEGRISKRFFAPVERVIYRVFMVDEKKEMDWKRYAISVLIFSALGMLAVYAILRAAGAPAAQPAGPARHDAAPRLQHGGQLHHRTRTGSPTAARRRSATSRRCWG